ncbi:glycosyltransferase [Bisgaard Taxon 45]
MKKNKPRILILIGTYLPGVKGGGPIRTIHNLVSRLKDEFEFYLITSDRDLNDAQSYPNIPLNKWIKYDDVNVYYLENKANLTNAINAIDYDILYLNSFFSPIFSIKPLLWRKRRLIKRTPVVLAPRGELSSAALSIKKRKKKLFVFVARLLSLYPKELVWQASSEAEKKDIADFLNQNNIEYKDIIIARNISNLKPASLNRKNNNTKLNICFLSRIAKMKNLYFALEVLQKIDFPVFLGIYGPLEDKVYWNQCLTLINNLPSNIEVKYYGAIENKQVQETISNYDLFFVPTQGENYGHVFIEALSAGTPILLSDKTPWRALEEKGIGWDIPLKDRDKFINALTDFHNLDQETRWLMKQKCLDFADSVVNSEEVLDANKKIFLDLV